MAAATLARVAVSDEEAGPRAATPLLGGRRPLAVCRGASLALGLGAALGAACLSVPRSGMDRVQERERERIPATAAYTNLKCDWLWGDDCKNMDRNACLCRAMNPRGRCRPCSYDTLLGVGAVSPRPAAKLAQPTAPATTTTHPMPLQELFCYMLVQPSGGELELARGARGLRAGIFNEACDGRRVYSSARVLVAGGEYTEAVVDASGAPLNMHCDFSPDGHRALNARVFYDFWRHLLRDGGEIFGYRWSAKVDADTVFLPQLLRPGLAARDAARAEYVDYCPSDGGYGHGPVEVVSRAGLRRLGASGRAGGLGGCQKLLGRDPTNREDWLMRRCLEKNGVKSIKLSVISEDTCPPTVRPGFECGAGKAAFHPYKDVESWRACWSAVVAR